jgi:hippurate hydrolase
LSALEAIRGFEHELVATRHSIHQHPELGFSEFRTSDLVASRLAAWGIEVHRGIAGTGVVGVLRAGSGKRSIGIRADMDALPLQEKNAFAHVSQVPGQMHACGHDGHTTMLLGAARYLAATKRFDGTVHFVFQPAEEGQGGARRMVEEGLFERFPMESIFGMHNRPGLEQGKLAVRPGPMHACADAFEVEIDGQGGHAAHPAASVDPVVVGAQVVVALQTIVSRNVPPLESAVVSVTMFQAGTAFNVIPDTVRLAGTVRTFSPRVRDLVERRMGEVVQLTAAAHGARANVRYQRLFGAVINHPKETEQALAAALRLLGPQGVATDHPPSMGSEDFCYMLDETPGCYLAIGNGAGEGGCVLHSPHYDFHDGNLVIGAAYWATLAEMLLKPPPSPTT